MPRGGHDQDSVALDAVVTDVEFCGSHTVVTLAVGGASVPVPGLAPGPAGSAGATLRSRFPARSGVRPGDAVRVAVEAGRAHVFAAVTGTALWHPDRDPSGPGDAAP
jgi:multiple sugar transport system ATP-binding protein